MTAATWIRKNRFLDFLFKKIVKMQYYDFKKNWKQFLKHWHSEEIIAMLEDENLTQPLYMCSRGDGMSMLIDQLACEDKRSKKLGIYFEDGCAQYPQKIYKDCSTDEDIYSDEYKKFDETFQKIREEYMKPDLIHVNIPSGHCHSIVEALFKIAKRMYPHKYWIRIYGDRHSAVYCPTENILFDLLMWFHYTNDPRIDYNADTVFANLNGKKGKAKCNGLVNTKLERCHYNRQ